MPIRSASDGRFLPVASVQRQWLHAALRLESAQCGPAMRNLLTPPCRDGARSI